MEVDNKLVNTYGSYFWSMFMVWRPDGIGTVVMYMYMYMYMNLHEPLVHISAAGSFELFEVFCGKDSGHTWGTEFTDNCRFPTEL